MDNSKNEWQYHSFNHKEGSGKVIVDCFHCYAEKKAFNRMEKVSFWNKMCQKINRQINKILWENCNGK
jgi:hypothetical protein